MNRVRLSSPKIRLKESLWLVLNFLLLKNNFSCILTSNYLFLFQSGASVEVKLPDKKETIEGVIVKIQDLSQYTVGKWSFHYSKMQKSRFMF